MLQLQSLVKSSLRIIPEGTSQATECRNEKQEDEKEDKVGTDSSDEVDQAEETHEDEEEGEGGGELGGCQAG
jgi:hypothetical protein